MTVLMLIVFTLTLFDNINGDRILAIYPFASISHQVVFRSLTVELAKRGHELVVITPDPINKEVSNETLTEIDTSDVYAVLRQAMGNIAARRGVKITADMLTTSSVDIIANMIDETFNVPEVKTLLEDPKQQFNLVIAESSFQSTTVLAKIFDCPLIFFSSYFGSPYNYAVLGAPSAHPFLYPNTFRNRFYNLSIWEKLYELYTEMWLWYIFDLEIRREEALLKKHFGHIQTNLDELNNLIDLLFVNLHPIFEGNRPVPPNIIHLGGMHLGPPKELSEEWQKFLDSSKRGVVYVSLGTNVRASAMEPSLLEVFMSAFEELDYDILWKFDGESLPRKLNNVRIKNWFPQREILNHPNVKAFVTQGGLQSTDEAIDSAVPMVGLPMLADQSFNCERYQQLGIGISLDIITLTSETFLESINTVIQDKSYQEKIKKLRDQIHDQPQTPLERAVWWTEYVLRHRGAKHLRSAQANISWYQYLMLDVFTVLATSVALIVLCVVFLVQKAKKIVRTKIKLS